MRKRKKMKWNKLRTWCKERLLRLKKPFIIVGCMWFVACIAGFFLNCLFTYHFKFRLDINLLVDGKTYLYALLLSAIALTVALAYYYKHYWLKNSKKIIQGDERDNDVATNLEQAHFQTDGEVDKNYAKISYAELPKTNLVGIPIRAVERKEDYEIHFAKNAHTMIIGTTGSGKTTTFINPAVQISKVRSDRNRQGFKSDTENRRWEYRLGISAEYRRRSRLLQRRRSAYRIRAELLPSRMERRHRRPSNLFQLRRRRRQRKPIARASQEDYGLFDSKQRKRLRRILQERPNGFCVLQAEIRI